VAMYSLELLCTTAEVDGLTAELWEAGTGGIRELDREPGRVLLIAGFENGVHGSALIQRFAAHEPHWREEPETDWVACTENSWPGRLTGRKFFLCPHWCREETPQGRHRLVHNPGLACGTGEHPCTQLGLQALEEVVEPAVRVVDIGTGSGILAVAACQLGASLALGIDPDWQALAVAQNNFRLNELPAVLAAGFADAVASGWADVTVANISGTVLLDIMDDLLRITRPGGVLVLTGFTEAELPTFESLVSGGRVLSSGEWRCLIGRAPDAFRETAEAAGTSLDSEE
jgi:ribosomal protein L11 methyltransferase